MQSSSNSQSSSGGPKPATPAPSGGHPLDRYSVQPQTGSGGEDKSPYYKPTAPQISLPKGSGAIKGIDEKFSVNPVNGTAALEIPLPLSPGRGGFTPALSLSYNSGGGNGECGLGWNLGLPAISRKTDRQLPQYNDAADSDVFLLAGAEDLVPALKEDGAGGWIEDSFITGAYLVRRYRPRIEGLFARIEFLKKVSDPAGWWRVTTKDNVTTWYGLTPAARLSDPGDEARAARWLPQLAVDGKGNAQVYEYASEDLAGVPRHLHEKARHSGIAPFGGLYLKRVKYGNLQPFTGGASGSPTGAEAAYEPLLPAATDWLMEAVLDYGDHHPDAPAAAPDRPWACRKDPFSDYRYGFEVRHYRLLRRVIQYHRFRETNADATLSPQIVRSLALHYAHDAAPAGGIVEADYITSAVQTGYRRAADGSLLTESLPPLTFDYSPLQWNGTVHEAEENDWEGAPQGLSGPYQWIDLWGEGLPGILHEDAGGGWHYKRNSGGGRFSAPQKVAPKPSFAGLGAELQWSDLDADGRRQLVSRSGGAPGYFEAGPGPSEAGDPEVLDWKPFRAFPDWAWVDWGSPHTRLLDLDGDGRPDLLLTDEGAWTWYRAKGTGGFGEGGRVDSSPLGGAGFDEDRGPRLLLSDAVQRIFLADMSGDGLTDLVRITAAEVCYWPNLGWGQFGARVTMSNSPRLDRAERFDPRLILLADISGTGAADLVYLADGTFRAWINKSGNGFSEAPYEIAVLPEAALDNSVAVLDFLGNGTGCIVWSSPLPAHSRKPLRYVDLMGGTKPYLLRGYDNGMGKSIALSYRSSTQYYLDDRAAGTPWATRLPFPVQCLAQTATTDAVSETTYTQHYAYHHGYYDSAEREFRGFGRVDTVDTDSAAAPDSQSTIGNGQSLDQAPVLTKTWYHTGAWMREGTLLAAFEEEYYPVPGSAGIAPMVGAALPAGLSPEEERQAYRALKGSPLRQEMYALDGSAEEGIPYTVTANTYRTRLEQPSPEAPSGSPAGEEPGLAVFFTHAEETLSWSCERNPADARLAQELMLDVDRWGNVTQSAQVAYPRAAIPSGLPGPVAAAQATAHITCSATAYTADLLPAGGGLSSFGGVGGAFRLRLPWRSRSYELRGAVAPAVARWSAAALKTAIAAAAPVDYSDNTTPGLCKRLLSESRTLFRGNNGTTVLPAGTMESLGLPHEAYALAFTAATLAGLYGGRVDGAMLNEGGYVDLDGDGRRWVPSGRAYYPGAPVLSFCTPTSYVDPWGAATTVAYWSDYWFLPQSTTDALENTTTVERYDWRSLQPERTADPNGNLTEAVYSPLGLPVAVALLGKDDGTEGDLLQDLNGAPFEPGSPDDRMLRDLFFEYPEAYAKDLLGRATWRCAYDFSARPLAVAMVARERHFADDEDSPVLCRFSYTDGFGRVMMHKAQAADDPLTGEERWVGSGRTAYNNKGKPVLQYEPYFSPTHTCDTAVQAAAGGVSPRIHYDPLGRAWKTEAPDGTFSYTDWDGWMQTVWDAADTVLQSAWWYKRTGTGALAAVPEEADAAAKSAEHAATPLVVHLDALGRPFYTIQHDRRPVGTVWTSAFYHSYEDLDIAGQRTAVHDARGLVPLRYRYNMLGAPGWQQSIDGGAGRMLVDAAGQPLYGWDAEERRTRMAYDALRRPLLTEVDGKVTGRTEYGEDQADAEVRNLRGQAYKTWDGAGAAWVEAYDFKGLPLESFRQYAEDYTASPDWIDPGAVAIEDATYRTAMIADALGRPVRSEAPDGSHTLYTYDKGGALHSQSVEGVGGLDAYVILAIEYDAKGQRTRIQYANYTSTKYTYDPLTFRVRRILTTRSSDSAVLQDLCYFYDAAGNITTQRDDAQQTVFFNNTVVTPDNGYTYDALYRLIKAEGREHTASNIPGSWSDEQRMRLPHKADATAVQRYTERYTYDAVGNILEVKHIANTGGWTRALTIDSASNKLLSTSVGGTSETYTHDERGNLTEGFAHLVSMAYNEANQLEVVQLSADRTAYYQYDGGGQRTRKTIVDTGTDIREERKYLGGSWEVYTKWEGSTVALQRETLHIADDAGRVALIDTRTEGDSDEPQQLLRYQYSNHLGSASLELDSAGSIISYEEYHPYGTTAFQSGRSIAEVSLKRYRYTGKERDEETGLNYHGARYYAPWLARWTAVDPLESKYAGLSSYNYCLNNPVMNHDPDGRQAGGGDDKNKPVAQASAAVGQAGAAAQGNAAVGEKSPQQQQQMQETTSPTNNNGESVPWYLHKTQSGELVLTLGIGKATTMDRIDYNGAPWWSDQAVSAFVHNTVAAGWNGVANSWNEAREGKTATDMFIETERGINEFVDHATADDYRRLATNPQTYENLTAGVITMMLARSIKLPSKPNDNILFRGTSTGYAGNPSLQRLSVTPTTRNPAVATVFGTNSSNFGQGVVFAVKEKTVAKLATVEQNVLGKKEVEVPLNLTPIEFQRLAKKSITATQASSILKNMGINIPSNISTNQIDAIIDALPPMNASQIAYFYKQFKKLSTRR